jgi:N-acetylglutamate synthase-like GNAT family acetyltransferase
MINIEIVATEDIQRVRALYDECGYDGGVAETDLVIAAKSGDALVGAVRICLEEGVTVLRGMQIKQAYQRRGIGRTLLSVCEKTLDRGVSYCLPYRHLVAFYKAGGFEVVAEATLPDFLQTRLHSYVSGGQNVIAMKRISSNPSLDTDACGAGEPKR